MIDVTVAITTERPDLGRFERIAGWGSAADVTANMRAAGLAYPAQALFMRLINPRH